MIPDMIGKICEKANLASDQDRSEEERKKLLSEAIKIAVGWVKSEFKLRFENECWRRAECKRREENQSERARERESCHPDWKGYKTPDSAEVENEVKELADRPRSVSRSGHRP